jgi:hypothetical protein
MWVALGKAGFLRPLDYAPFDLVRTQGIEPWPAG